MYLAIAGNIGAGKSTLTGLLAEAYHLTPVFEVTTENPYLEDFYRDMPRYAFHSQMVFLAKRLEQHLGEVNLERRVIQDRTIYEDAQIFARNLSEQGMMTSRDYQSYMLMYRAISQALRPPDLLIYLRASIPTLQARIRVRGRSFEQQISESYLTQLNQLYERFIAEYDLSPVITVSVDDRDFLNERDLRYLMDKLERQGLTAPVL
jgi:deoxyadenosine/deoxycytidine kinase